MTNCTDCGVEQSSDNSYRDSRRAGHFRSRCSACYGIRYRRKKTPEARAKAAADARRYRAENPDKARRNYLRNYGITPEEYDQILEHQGGRCGICGTWECSTGSNFAVDHDHTCCDRAGSCGKCVRGLLCRKCNVGLGNLGDNTEALRRAIEYLERGRG